jgi:hypothetical protein
MAFEASRIDLQKQCQNLARRHDTLLRQRNAMKIYNATRRDALAKARRCVKAQIDTFLVCGIFRFSNLPFHAYKVTYSKWHHRTYVAFYPAINKCKFQP